MSPTDVPAPVLPRSPRRLGPRGTTWFDRTLCVVLLGLSLLGAVSVGAFEGYVGVALAFGQCLPLWWRRTHPVACHGVVVLASAAQVVWMDAPLFSQFAYPIAVYSVARFAAARWGVLALAVGLVAAVVAAVDWTRPYLSDDVSLATAATSYAVTIGVIVLAAWSLGTLGRTREAYVRSLVDHADYLAREAEQRAELAASDERARIAREMHDVVAHGLSVIIVQADGGRYAAAKDPDAAAGALETVAATGREALAEMRRLLGLLRTEASGVRPQPAIADLPWLLEQAAADGLPLTVELPDPLPALTDSLGLVVYRVAQESLTNVRRHAGAVDDVRVAVSVGADSLMVEVVDDGRGAAVTGSPTGGGLGLVGMRERVLAVGGSLDAGPRPGGGFAVRARLPR